ncbi:MAG: DUF2147 domain-containing protein [Burkholderiales bacterium]|nr:DUF2147 domain-containing protein [Burkholderiales bacterium]
MMARFLALLLWAGIAWASPPTPEGVWRVIGDKSGEAEALVRIIEREGVYEGTIVKVFPRPGVDPSALCELCPGERKNKPVEGLAILTGMRWDGKSYAGGEILDPDSGEIYRCGMKLSGDGQKLELRGYIMMPLLGRSQTWLRERSP